MSNAHRDTAPRDGSAGPAPSWELDRQELWTWLDTMLASVDVVRLDAEALRALCLQALDTHAPAMLVDAQAVGVYLEYLVYALLNEQYRAVYGRPRPPFAVDRLREALRRARLEGN